MIRNILEYLEHTAETQYDRMYYCWHRRIYRRSLPLSDRADSGQWKLSVSNKNFFEIFRFQCKRGKCRKAATDSDFAEQKQSGTGPAAKLNVVPFAGSGAEGSVNQDMEDERRKTEHESFKFRRRYEYIRKNFSGILCRYRKKYPPDTHFSAVFWGDPIVFLGNALWLYAPPVKGLATNQVSGILCRYRRTFSGLCMRTVLFSMVSLPSD